MAMRFKNNPAWENGLTTCGSVAWFIARISFSSTCSTLFSTRDNTYSPPQTKSKFSVRYFLIAVALLISTYPNKLFCQTPDGTSRLTEPGKAFKEYEANVPPIKHIVYEQSYSVSKHGPGVMWADGAIQPGGYFNRQLTNSPYTQGILIDGASTEQEWESFPENENVCYGPRTYWTNSNVSMNLPVLRKLQTVACLGLPRCFPGHDGFTWTSPVAFQFFNPYDHFTGHIASFDEVGRPKEVEYHSVSNDAPEAVSARITYAYDSREQFPPASFIIELNGIDLHSVTTNILHKLELGIDEAHEQHGFYLKDFLPDNANVGTIYVISNLVRYTLQPDKSMVAYKYSDAVEQSTHPVHYAIIFASLAVITSMLAYLVRRRGKNPAPEKPHLQ